MEERESRVRKQPWVSPRERVAHTQASIEGDEEAGGACLRHVVGHFAHGQRHGLVLLQLAQCAVADGLRVRARTSVRRASSERQAADRRQVLHGG